MKYEIGKYKKGDSYLSLNKIREKRKDLNFEYFAILKELREKRINHTIKLNYELKKCSA